MTDSDWGQIPEGGVRQIELTNRQGLRLTATNFGATLTGLWVPDKQGKLEDVALGFETFSEYERHRLYLGATAGRVANRIRGGECTVGGTALHLDRNDPPHHLHGGVDGWDRKLWAVELLSATNASAVKFSRTSPAGEAGYPGTVRASVVYELTDDNCLVVRMSAQTDALTVVNLAHHSYWNLGGANVPTILEHQVKLFANEYTPGDPVPTGVVVPVEDTPFDFRTPKTVGQSLADTARYAAPGAPLGFDHNWVVSGVSGQMRPVAEVLEPHSGRRMTVSSDAPGVQFYTGNFLDGQVSGKGRTFCQHAGLCLETQAFPNAVNVPQWAAQVLLAPGEQYRHEMRHQFSVQA